MARKIRTTLQPGKFARRHSIHLRNIAAVAD